MISEQLLLSKNIHNICYETVQKDIQGMKFPPFSKSVINFFIKHIIGTKNMYPAIFLSCKLDALERIYNNASKKDIKRKTLLELLVFLSICTKPSPNQKGFVIDAKARKAMNEAKETNPEQMLIKELQTQRREGAVIPLVDGLIKTKEDELWNIAFTLVKHIPVRDRNHLHSYINALNALYIRVPKKELLLEAFRSLSYESAMVMFYDNNEYSPILFQCMLKINYIYEEEGEFDKHFDLYKACIYCPTQWLLREEEDDQSHIESHHFYEIESKSININNNESSSFKKSAG